MPFKLYLRIFRAGLLGSGLVALVSLGLDSAVAASAAPAKAKSDLVISKIEFSLPGPPPYIALGSTGEAPNFTIEVTTRNDGAGSAGPSTTHVQYDDGVGKPKTKTFRIPRLNKNGEVTKSWTITGLKPPLGFIKVVGLADLGNHIDESNDGNNTRTREIAVIARRWDVAAFSTTVEFPGVEKSVSSTEDGFYFRFDDLDKASENFVYQAIGPIKEDFTEMGGCTGHGSKTADKNPWANSKLEISVKLNAYHSLIKASEAKPFNITITCVNVSHVQATKWSDLITVSGKGKVPMTPDDTVLKGTTPDPKIDTTFAWIFKADIK